MILGRFTREARRCVKEAVEEARALGHDSVGDEDLVLGVLAADEGLAGEALASLGISLGDAREEAGRMFADALASVGISVGEVERRAGGSLELGGHSFGRLPFSPRAKKALEGALREGMRLGHKKLTGEHILLGALRDERGMAARMLVRLGVSPETVEERLDLLGGRA